MELPLLSYADEKTVLTFARAMTKDPIHAPTSLDDTIDLGRLRKVPVRYDAMAGLGRADGHPMLVGALEVSAASSRIRSVGAPLSEVPAVFGVHRGGSIDLATVRAALSDAVDVMLSPGGDTLLVVEKNQIEVFDVAAMKVVEHVDIGAAANGPEPSSPMRSL